MEPFVDCTKVKGMLSDLLDVRRGEQPAPMDSPLGTPEVLDAVEKHVASCPTCTQELHKLEELGRAFAEFAAEEPGQEHFAGYARMVRQRVRRMTQKTIARPAQARFTQWRTWLSAVVTSAAAAVLTVMVLNPAITGPRLNPDDGKTAAANNAKQEMKGYTKAVKVADAATHTSKEASPTVAGNELPDLSKLQPRDLSLVSWGPGGMRQVNVGPETDMSRLGSIRLGDSSKALVGVMFAADERTVPEGLRVVAVKKNGVADAIGLRPEDRLLSLNGMRFPNSSPEEIVKFFHAVESLGRGKLIQVDFARKDGDNWIIKRGRGELGKFK